MCSTATEASNLAREQVHKMMRIGTGLYAHVYDAGDHAVKIATGREIGYLSFLKVIDGVGDEFSWLPKIHSVVHYKTTGTHPCANPEDLYVIRMEKLVPFCTLRRAGRSRAT